MQSEHGEGKRLLSFRPFARPTLSEYQAEQSKRYPTARSPRFRQFGWHGQAEHAGVQACRVGA